MSLLFCEGFDLGALPGDWAPMSANPSTTSATAFGTGLAMSIAGNNNHIDHAFPAAAEVFIGIRYGGSASMITTNFLSLYGDANNNNSAQISLQWQTSTTLAVYRGGTQIATGTAPEPVNTWSYLEIRVLVSAAATGRVVVKVDGNTIIDFTGITKNSTATNASVDTIRLYGGNGITRYYDDLYICDTAGAAPYNTFLGPRRIYGLAPTAAGAQTQLTPSTAPNWDCVNEAPYSATDYVQGGTTGNRDTYVMADLPASVQDISAVRAVAVAKATDAAAVSLKTVVRSGGTVYGDTAVSLGTTDAAVSGIRTVDPATGVAWTASGVNALEAGVEVA